jgi:hypothetical protein
LQPLPNSDDEGVLYVSKSAQINVPITCSGSIKTKDKAIALITEGETNCTAARVALADTMRKIAQLELEMAIHVRKIDFIRTTLSLCEDLDFHTLKNEQISNTTRSTETFAFPCFQSFSKAQLNKDFFVKLLSSNPTDVYDGMLTIAALPCRTNTDQEVVQGQTLDRTSYA